MYTKYFFKILTTISLIDPGYLESTYKTNYSSQNLIRINNISFLKYFLFNYMTIKIYAIRKITI